MIRAALFFLALLPAGAAGAACTPVTFDGAAFTTCRVDLATDDLRLFLRDPDGAILGSFSRVQSILPDGKELAVAMNAGMFHTDRAPVGLYIENGVEEMRLITSDGPGNFGLLPNGVFCLTDDRAHVIESRAFADGGLDCRFASQSGPMLVIDGALHPRFIADSDSLNVRNGVGVSSDGQTVWLAISDQPVNFDHFGRLFRDALETPDALFFDGRVSRLYAPEIGRGDIGFPVGPIIGTVVDAAGADG